MKDIIVIPFNVPWNWSTDYLNQTAFELSKKGDIVVCYLWGDVEFIKEMVISGKYPRLVSKYSKNIYLVNPIYFIPFRRFKFMADLNSVVNILFLRIFVEVISSIKKCKKKIFWIFDPNLTYIYKYFGYKYFLLYDCVDFFAVGNKKKVEITKRNEQQLCCKADLVVANSQVLQRHLQKYRKNVGLVPQGFRLKEFKIKSEKYINLNIQHPVVGFVGGINNRLDISILLPLIKNNPRWNFVIWGSIQKNISTGDNRFNLIKKILKLPNVYSGESIDKEEIPGIISQFDVGMIPYDISQDFNKYCYPMKLFEFFYLGKPVISTNIIELKRFPKLVKIGNDYREWERIIKYTLSKKWSEQNIEDQVKLAKLNSWENKIVKINQLLDSAS